MATSVGLLSDTHGFLDDKIFKHFESVDEIWHAGDIGDIKTLDTLMSFKPVRAVFGNIDSIELRKSLKEDLWFEINGVTVLISHIGGYPPKYNQRMRDILNNKVPDLLICGHSHILKIMTDPGRNNMLYINPGAAGNQGFHQVKTLVRFSLLDKKVNDLQVIEIGRRG